MCWHKWVGLGEGGGRNTEPLDFKDTLCINPGPFILDHIPTVRAQVVRHALHTLRAVLAINRRKSKDKDSTENKTEDGSKRNPTDRPLTTAKESGPYHLINI